MGRTIDIELVLENKTKTLTIEYDRETVLQLMEAQGKETSGVGSAIDLLYYGCLKHHRKDMPTREELALLIVSVEDAEGLIQILTEMIKEVVDAFQQAKTKGNSKWVERK